MSDFIPWTGGKCPVEPMTWVEITSSTWPGRHPVRVRAASVAWDSPYLASYRVVEDDSETATKDVAVLNAQINALQAELKEKQELLDNWEQKHPYPLIEYEAGQWWHLELKELVNNTGLTLDQRRAANIASNLIQLLSSLRNADDSTRVSDIEDLRKDAFEQAKHQLWEQLRKHGWSNASSFVKTLEYTALPVAMQLRCPKCDEQHVDEGMWAIKLHKTHQCQKCGHEWKPYEYATVGIAKTDDADEYVPDAEVLVASVNAPEVNFIGIVRNSLQRDIQINDDAERYQVLRDRLEIKNVFFADGGCYPALTLRIGCSRLDRPGSPHSVKDAQLDQALDQIRQQKGAKTK